MLGTCNTCVRLQSRVTSSGATVNSWMIFIYLFIYFHFILFLCIYLLLYLFIFSFLSFVCLFCLFLFCGCWFCFYFLLVYFLLCAFKFVFFFFSFPSLFILRSVFILLCVGLGLIFRCLENKISYLGVVYKFLSMGMELAVIKELFIILYI